MAPKSVFSWAEGLGVNRILELLADHDDGTLLISQDDTMDRDGKTSKAKTTLEGKHLDAEDESVPENVGEGSLYGSSTLEEDPPSVAPCVAARLSRLPATCYEPESAPRRPRLSGRNLTDLARELQEILPAQELQEIPPAYQRSERTSITKPKPVHVCDESSDAESWNSESQKPLHVEEILERPISEPVSHLRARVFSKFSSWGTSLQPSEAPYSISWLWPAHFGGAEPSEAESSPAITRSFNHKINRSPHGRSTFIRESISKPPTIEKKLPTPHTASHQRQKTLTPDDSISVCDPNEYMDLQICIPPELYHHSSLHRRPTTILTPTTVPDDLISYCASPSTHFEFYDKPNLASMVTLKRYSFPKPIVPPKTEKLVKRRSMDAPMPLSSDQGALPIYRPGATSTFQPGAKPTFRPEAPPKDLEAAPIRTVSKDSHDLEPLNGIIAWLHAIAGFLVVFNCWGINYSFGLFQAYYELVYLQGSDPSSIAWIGSTQICLCFALGVPVGRLVDRGHFRAVFAAGTVIMLLGLFCTAWCTQLWTLWLIQGLVSGTGMGMVFCSGTIALMTWFDERHMSTAMALPAAGSCVGGIVYVLLARHFLPTMGFANTMRILGGVAAITMLPTLFIFRVRGQRPRDTEKGPKRSDVVHSPSYGTILRSFLEPSYLLASIGLLFAFLGVYFGFVFMVSYGSLVLHLSNTDSTNLLIFMLATNLPGRFLPALLSDKCIGPLNTLIPGLFLSAGIIGLWISSAQTYSSLVVIACFYGFVSAGVQVLYAPTVYSFCMEITEGDAEPTVAMDKIGVKAGGIFTCIGVACLVGTPIGGTLISYRMDRGLEQPFLGAQIFAMACLLSGGVLLLASRVRKTGGWKAIRV